MPFLNSHWLFLTDSLLSFVAFRKILASHRTLCFNTGQSDNLHYTILYFSPMTFKIPGGLLRADFQVELAESPLL